MAVILKENTENFPGTLDRRGGLRILIVTNLYPAENSPTMETFVKEQVECLRDNYTDLTVDVCVIAERPRWVFLREMLLVPTIVKRGKYDIVHVHFGLNLITTLFVRVPLIVTFHGSDLLVSPTKYLSRLLARMATKVIVVSQRLKKCLGYGEVIPCGIHVKKFTLPLRYAEKGIPNIPGEIKILFPSNPVRKIKDYGLFGEVRQELEARGNKVQEVHLANIERSKVYEVYWDSDVMLLTSLSEGSPTVIKEAIAAKLPFVSVDVGDVKEWASLVDFGLVVAKRDPKIMADAVCTLLRRIKYRKLLDNRKCLDAMDLGSTCKKIRLLYQEALQTRVKSEPGSSGRSCRTLTHDAENGD